MVVDAEHIGISLQAVANWQPETVQRFVYQEWAQPNKVIDFNWWLGLAEAAVGKTFEVEPVDLQWALTAVSVYQLLASRDTERTIETSLMRFKARLLKHYGDVEAVPFVSVHEVINWFLHEIPMTYPEVQEAITQYKNDKASVPTKILRQLRGIKNQLKILELLRDFREVHQNQDLHQWLEIQKHLP